MNPAPIRSKQYHDAVACSRRRKMWLRNGLIFCSIVATGIIGVWIFSFSSIFAVATIDTRGATTLGNDRVVDSVRSLLDERHLYIFQPKKNILLLDADTVSEYLIRQHSVIASVSVTKHYPHSLEVRVTERVAIGQWCIEDVCRFFDKTGVRWGSALPSKGPLLLLVVDERDDNDIDQKMFVGMMSAVEGLPTYGTTARILTLPNAEPGSAVITTDKKYDIYIDALGNVADQLSVFGVFIADQAKDSTFAPKYIDLRTPGRVYYQ